MNINVQSNIRDYEVIFEKNISFLKEYGEKENHFFVIDENVAKHHPEILANLKDESVYLIEAIETNKTIEYAFGIYDFLLKSNAKKNIVLVSIGGGITQDVTGFVASTLYRGIGWIYVPTTFLAMTDSCIGGKTSINYGENKNILGTFFPPRTIYIHTPFLDTLPELDMASGIGEVLKFQLMKNGYQKDFDAIAKKIEQAKESAENMQNIIFENLNIKLEYILDDEFDQGKRNLLNYGHCLGHALETVSEYYIPHGIAVNIGMMYSNFLSFKRGLLSLEEVEYINNTLLLPNMPLKLREKDFEAGGVLAAMRKDKKRTGKLLSSVYPDEKFELLLSNDISDEECVESLDLLVNYLF